MRSIGRWCLLSILSYILPLCIAHQLSNALLGSGMSISLLKISCPDVSETDDVALLIPPPCISRMLNMCTSPQSSVVELAD